MTPAKVPKHFWEKVFFDHLQLFWSSLFDLHLAPSSISSCLIPQTGLSCRGPGGELEAGRA